MRNAEGGGSREHSPRREGCASSPPMQFRFFPDRSTSRVHLPRTLLSCEHGWDSRLAAFFNLEKDDYSTLSLLDPDTQRVNPTE